MKRLGYLLIAVALMMSGCGGVDWFPAFVRQPTTPDLFFFPTKTGVAVSTVVTSDPITVAGLTATDSPISVTGSAGSNSLYAVNGGTATATAGNVKNGDTVTVTQTSASALGVATTSTLTIGNITGTFTTISGTVGSVTPVNKTGAAGTFVFSGGIPLNLLSGSHTVTITDGLFSFDNFVTSFTVETLPINNQQQIFLRNTAAIGTGNTVTTILSIDGVQAIIFTTTTL